jgi:hypothetical protein
MGAFDKSQAFIHALRRTVLGCDVQERRQVCVQDTAGEVTHKHARQAASSRVRMGTDCAELHVIWQLEPFSGKRNQPSFLAHTNVGAQVEVWKRNGGIAATFVPSFTS